MQEYKGLLKEKGKALGIFEKTKARLQTVVSKIQQEYANNLTTIERANHTIEERKLANEFLNEELDKTAATINKIDAILE